MRHRWVRTRALVAAVLVLGSVKSWGLQLLASDPFGDRVISIDLQTHATTVLVQGGAGGLDNPLGMAVGRDGNLLVASGGTNDIKKYDIITGKSLGVFATGAPTPIGMRMGPDHDLYVACRDGHGVYHYDGQTGQLKSKLQLNDNNTLWWAYDLEFTGSNELLLSSFERGSILKFNRTTGNSSGSFSGESNGYAGGITFGPGGDLFVARFNGNRIERLDGVTGASKGTFAVGNGIKNPSGVTFAPDGNLYVANERSSDISVFNGITGAPVGVIPETVDGYDFMIVVPEPSSAAVMGLGLVGLLWGHRGRSVV